MYKGKNVTSVAFFCVKSIKLAELFAKTCTCHFFCSKFGPPASGLPPKIRSHFAGHMGSRGHFFGKTGLTSLHLCILSNYL